jgi:hypothetical protein
MRVQGNRKLISRAKISGFYPKIERMALEGFSVNQVGRAIGASGDNVRAVLRKDNKTELLELLAKNGKQRRKCDANGVSYARRNV